MSTSAPALLTKIVKRNGTTVPFKAQKITRAIEKAMRASGEFKPGLPELITSAILEVLQEPPTKPSPGLPTVEGIQDLIEKMLMHQGFDETAKRYILYREQHAQIRRLVNTETIDLMDHYLDQMDWQVKENSNMAFSLQGLNNYIASEVSKTYWLDKIYPKEVKEAHLSGDFHLHDLNLLSVYCVGWDLYDLLQRGFGGVAGKIQSKPPKSCKTV